MLALVPSIELSGLTFWPEVVRFSFPLPTPVCVHDDAWGGFWGAWPGMWAPLYIGAELRECHPDCHTKIDMGIGQTALSVVLMNGVRRGPTRSRAALHDIELSPLTVPSPRHGQLPLCPRLPPGIDLIEINAGRKAMRSLDQRERDGVP
ncbi:MAG: hypothetical protein IT348_14665, partial [Candidatus Eisenbacteria bacterium]|nr:hypothetical protein [Candidatus Eisenbacteria bacterium]